MTMPISDASPSKNSLSLLSLMNLHRRRPADIHLFLLVLVGEGRQRIAGDVAHRIFERVHAREFGPHVVLGDEAAIDVAGADAKLQHHRGIGRLRKLEALLHHVDDGLHIRARIEQPHLRFHREGVAALLHDRGALAVILADDDQRAALHAARGKIGQRVGRDIGADRGLEGAGAAQRIAHRDRQRRGGGRLVRARIRSGRQAPSACRWRRSARRSDARSARPDSPTHRTRRIAAAPW